MNTDDAAFQRSRGWDPVAPREAARRMVEERLGTACRPGDDPAVFPLADFQAEALRRATEILERWGGVVVADSVGLGKTYVALGLIERALRGGGRVAVVTPAALRGSWRAPLRRLAGAVGVRRTSGIGPLDPEPGGPGGAALAWLSHARLSRGTHRPERLAPLELVVVDEAHAFRNPATRRYRALADLCREARVALLTATPVNNTLSDLYFLLRLFAGDGAFRDLGVPDLGAVFRAAGEAAATPPGLRRVLDAVVIRRTRAGVRPGSGGAGPLRLRFPRRADPTPVRYGLDAAYPGVYEELAGIVETLALAPLRLEAYGLARGDGRGGSELVRLGLLKRLESSAAAFRASVARQRRFLARFADALDRGRLLLPRDAGSAGGDLDPAQLVLEELTLAAAPAALDRARVAADVRADLARLDRARTLLPAGARDPKAERLIALLDLKMRGEKVVVFTEFRETALWLWKTLAPRGGVGLVAGDEARLGAARCGRRAVIERFAPRANGAREPPPRERVDLLVATDVLSEGMNLQDAAHVVSYDLPWNPVRLIQRVGRVDRLGSPHEVVHPYLFLPDGGLERLLGLLARIRAKLAAIERSVGPEGAVLDAAGVEAGAASLIARLAAGDPGALELRGDALPGTGDWQERLRRAAAACGEAGVPTPGRPAAATLAARGDEAGCTLVALATRAGPQWLLVGDGGAVRHDDEAAAAVLVRALEEAADTLALDHAALDRAAVRAAEHVRGRAARLDAAGSLPPGSPGARAARLLQAALAAVPGGPSPDLCRRADALLAALAAPLDAGTESAVRRALAAGPAEAGALVAVLESTLKPLPHDGGRRGAEPETPVVTGAIRVLPPRREPRKPVRGRGLTPGRGRVTFTSPEHDIPA